MFAKLQAALVERFPTLGTDVGATLTQWLGIQAEKVAQNAPKDFANWGGEFVNDSAVNTFSEPKPPVATSPPVVIGEDMRNRVIPFAQKYGFDYYTPGPSLGSMDADLAANKAWMESIVNQGRTFVDIGRAPGRVEPSPFYLMESGIVNQNRVPAVSFSGFAVKR